MSEEQLIIVARECGSFTLYRDGEQEMDESRLDSEAEDMPQWMLEAIEEMETYHRLFKPYWNSLCYHIEENFPYYWRYGCLKYTRQKESYKLFNIIPLIAISEYHVAAYVYTAELLAFLEKHPKQVTIQNHHPPKNLFDSRYFLPRQYGDRVFYCQIKIMDKDYLRVHIHPNKLLCQVLAPRVKEDEDE